MADMLDKFITLGIGLEKKATEALDELEKLGTQALNEEEPKRKRAQRIAARNLGPSRSLKTGL